jgi:acetyl-CoA acyltransferase
MVEAYIIDALRTPFGRFGGSLAMVRPDDMAAHVIRALVERNPSVDWELLDDVLIGCANQAGEDNRNVARMAALLAGLPVEAPGSTVNRLCGSSMETVGLAARAIKAGEADLVIAGGVESMSRAPLVMPKPEEAFSRRAVVYDTTLGWRFVNPAMQQHYGIDSMPETAENVARDFGVSRQDQDAFAFRSQVRTSAAQSSGLLAQELVPVTVSRGKGDPQVVDTDEHPRPGTTLETLAALKPLFPPDGTVTAGNASGINDGATALLLASTEALERFGLVPRARVLGMAVAGVPPRIMGIGPVPATRKLIARLGMAIGDFEVVELNEAFAAQSLSVLRQLGLPDDAAQVNPNGGAISLGHPLGASGGRLIMAALHQLERTGGRYGLCTMCIGIGQGIATVIERVS